MLESENKGFNRYLYIINILIVLSHFLQAKTCHPSSLQGLPQPGGHQEDDSLEDEEDIDPLVEGGVWWRILVRGAQPADVWRTWGESAQLLYQGRSQGEGCMDPAEGIYSLCLHTRSRMTQFNDQI